jgi:hypothetical protein
MTYTYRVEVKCNGTTYLGLGDDEVTSLKIGYTPSVDIDEYMGEVDPGANINTVLSEVITISGRLAPSSTVYARLSDLESMTIAQGGTVEGINLQILIVFGTLATGTLKTINCVLTNAEIDFGNGRVNDIPYTLKFVKVEPDYTWAI